MNEMMVHIVTPDAVVFEGAATRLRFYGMVEQFVLLPRHAPTVEWLEACEIHVLTPNDDAFYVGIASGVLEVSDEHVHILVKEAILTDRPNQALEEMKREKKNRKAQTDHKRNQLIKSEMELYRLLRQSNDA